ncbi:MAG: RIP metalloprotease RseP [Pseudomonadota bacterium]|nr:RIP metalloprotease RseP [Pseudomonadota bacterium]
MNMIIISILSFLVTIGLLVAIHEWGHYIVARLVGVKVLRFSIGFGKPLYSRKLGPDETEYCIAAIPLGGYVKLLDEREGDVDPADLERTFNRQTIMKRIAILVAGPAMNFFFAILAYWLMFVYGVPGVKPIIGEVEPSSIAAKAGLRKQDQFISIAGRSVATWEGTILTLIDEMLKNPRVTFEVLGKNGDSRLGYLELEGKISNLTEPGNFFTGLGFESWTPVIPPVIDVVSPGGSAALAGMLPGDIILSAFNENINSWTEWTQFIRARPNEKVDVAVQRDGLIFKLLISIDSKPEDNGGIIGFVGTSPVIPENLFGDFYAEQSYGLNQALPVAIERTWSMSSLTLRMITRMFTGDVSIKNISGPINIAQYAGYSVSTGFASFLSFLAIISLSLGILNLLPIPMLDGGQIVYQTIEAIKGQPLSEQAQLLGQKIGIVFLMLIMTLAFYNDLNSIF